MINLLVAEDNIHYAKTLINYILKENKDIRLINLSTNGKETLETIYSNAIDLIILDLKMPALSGIDVLNSIMHWDLEPDPIIVVLSGESEMISKIRDYDIVSIFLNKSVGLEKINNSIIEEIKKRNESIKEKDIKEKIFKELLNLGFNIRHIGTTYIAETIEFIYQINNKQYCENLEKNIYSKIARIHFKSIQNIKTNIVKATNNMYMECDRNKLMSYFSFEYDYKPTPKMIINTILMKL